MKKNLLFIAAFAMASAAMADGWDKPVYSGPYSPLTPGEIVYIYNVGAKQFLTAGNDWGTHASVGDTGMLFTIEQGVQEDAEWDGVSYIIKNSETPEGDWQNMFITDGGNVYLDRREQADYYFSFTDKGSNIYNIIGSPLNPVWNANGDNTGYMLAHYTGYFNSKDGIATGTGVIYDYLGEGNPYQAGEINADWTFVSRSDYAAYDAKIEAYLTALDLKVLIDEAQTMGVDVADALALYANTSATADQLKEGIDALNTKILAYYETSVTPDTPKDLTNMIANAECNATDGWTNNLGATTWNTQTWIDDSWEGMEGNTLNIWAASLKGTVSQSLTGLPKGIYVFSLAAYSEKMDGYVFANENKKSVVGTSAGKIYEVTTEVTDGTLSFGYGQDEEGTNWVAIDNASLKYYGSGVEAYRYWLNGLLESAPSFNEVVVQDALLKEYEAVLASVNTVTTKDEILGIIPKYEEILNRINVNVEAYSSLKKAMDDADIIALNANERYGSLIADFNIEVAGEALESHTLDTEGVNAIIADLKKLSDEAQNYIWNADKLYAELEKAEGIYNEYSATCAPDAVEAYNEFMKQYDALDKSQLLNADVLALLDQLYAIEFNLQVPVDPASDENPIDYTAKLFNPSFNGVDGWTNAGWATFANNTWYGFANEEGASSGDGNYLNLWNQGNARGSQTITGLPAGAYTIQCGAYADKEGLQIFANENTVDIAVGQNEANEYMRIYTIDVVVGTEGTIEFGVQNTNGGEQWAMIDEVHLFYKGTESIIIQGVENIAAITSTNIAHIYSTNGTEHNSIVKGLNIIKFSDGSVKKVLFK